MTSVGVIIPWYQTAPDQWRDRALAHVLTWWETNYPTWPVILGTTPADDGPWRKGLAVHQALDRLSTEMVVVADADVICDGLTEAVDQISALRVGWAIPHRLVYRLTDTATTLVYQDGRYPPLVRVGVTSPDYREVHSGFAGGGLVVLPTRLLVDVPIDPRFAGWGQEDHSWARALTMIVGHPWRGRAPLYHLWHDPQPKMSLGVGSPEGYALWQRYQTAATLPAMLDLVEEARQALQAMAVPEVSTSGDVEVCGVLSSS